ncbi:MAG: phosphotransferase family protein [Gammaproteobacteria bacterium]|nr:phosphotransferase family protein [Gammaproteobacteria bacterium]
MEIDRPATVRAGEELDGGRLRAFLATCIDGLEGEIEVRQFPSGFSNLTYAVRIGARELVLRRPPFGTKPRSGHDMRREFQVLSALGPHFPYGPKVLAFCDDPDVLGCDFYVMERIEGIIVRREYPPALAGQPALVRRQHETFVDVLADLHSVDFVAAGLGDLGRPAGYVERQVRGWTKRQADALTPDAPDTAPVVAWLEAHLPAGSGQAALIHNDYKLDNVVFAADDPTRLIGVLDWEMATLGDPLMDLGCTLSYWVERNDPPYMDLFRMMPTNVKGALTRTEVLARYASRRGMPIDGFGFYYVFGLFRLAVVLQQIYYRYYHGQTADPRFGALGPQPHALIRAAQRAMRGGVD